MATSARRTGLDASCGALDAVLVPRGFAAAQVGVHGTSGQAIWCSRSDEFSARYPGLVTEADEDGRCVDLVVDLVRDTDHHVDDGGWRVEDVRLDTQHLGDALRHVGEPASAARAEALLGGAVSAVTPSLVRIVVALLQAAWPPEDRLSP